MTHQQAKIWKSPHFNKIWPEAHNQKPWTPLLGLVLTLPRMSTKQPRCLTTIGNLPTPASKAYLVTLELKKLKKHTFERFFENGTLDVCYTCSKDLLHGTPDRPLLTNGGRKSVRGHCWFECENTATAGCLVDIPGSLRTNPNNGLLVMGFWFGT